jgi:hypothetical protein
LGLAEVAPVLDEVERTGLTGKGNLERKADFRPDLIWRLDRLVPPRSPAIKLAKNRHVWILMGH